MRRIISADGRRAERVAHGHQRAAGGRRRRRTGRLGLRFDRGEYATNGRLRITEVVPLGPAAVTRRHASATTSSRSTASRSTATTNLDELLAAHDRQARRAVGERRCRRRDARGRRCGRSTRRPRRTCCYRAVGRENRALRREGERRPARLRAHERHERAVARAAATSISTPRTTRKDGVVIDVRNNNGGFVNVYAIDVLARRSYFNMTPRGCRARAARTVLGQRALERPTILVTNQHSLSDAEDFTEGYRTLKLGKVVGEPTAAGSSTPGTSRWSTARCCACRACASPPPTARRWS